MLPIKRYLGKSLKSLFYAAFAVCAFLWFENDALATYSAAILGNGFIVVGTDSRQTEGTENNDAVCKIIPVNDHLVVTLLGAKRYGLIDGKALDIVDLIKNRAGKYVESMDNAVESFADEVVRNLNTAGVKRSEAAATHIVFGGFDKNGTTTLKGIGIEFEDGTFRLSEIRNVILTDRVISFSLPNYTANILRRMQNEGRKLQVDANNPDADARLMKDLIEYIINDKYYSNIGGVPSIAVVRPGTSLEWISRAAECPRR